MICVHLSNLIQMCVNYTKVSILYHMRSLHMPVQLAHVERLLVVKIPK